VPIHHVVTIQVAAGEVAAFTDAFNALRAITRQEPGCERYELFRSTADPDRMVMLERWANQELLDKHMAAERAGNSALIDALVALWAPGTTPTVERFES
jgi:quinol monooxygenase YgiN